MAIQSKAYLKNKFKTGDIPTGQDFADFIETFVASFNGEFPEVTTGDIKYQSKYNVIEPVPPMVPWDDVAYPEGTSVFITQYTGQPEWDEAFGEIKPPQGDIMVMTTKMSGDEYCVQEVDAIKDGVFEAQFVRVNSITRGAGGWGDLKVMPDDKIEIVDNLFSDEEESALSARQGKILYEMISDIEDLATGPQGPAGPAGPTGPQGPPGDGDTNLHHWQFGMSNPDQYSGDLFDFYLNLETGDVFIRMVAGWAKYGNIHNGDTIIVENELDSTSTENALSANMGKTLYDMNNFIMDELEDHVQQKASAGALGHVRVDNITIEADPNTAVISVKGGLPTPIEIVDNILTQDASKALSANMGYVLDNRMDDLYDEQERLASFMSEYDRELDAHKLLKASTTTLGHVKIDGTTVKMNNNDQMYVDLSDLPIPIQMNSEYIMSDSPTTYPIGHVISMIGPDDRGFADLVTEFSLEYDVDLSATSTRFIVQTVKNDKNMTHQTAQAVTANRGSVLGTMYRLSQSSIYGFSSWYAQTQVLTGRGAPGDQGRGEGMSGNLYVNSVTGKVHAKAGYDKTVGYTNWRLVGPAVVNNTFDPVEDDDEHVYSAYTVEQMFEGAKNNLKNNVKLNRVWDSRPITANATTWTVDFSDEEELTDLNNYYFEVYDDGVLVFGNPITHTVNNENKTVTFTPQTPMSRPFTITCIGRGMEFPQ